MRGFGPIPSTTTITIGTTALSGGTTGSILFVGTSSVIQQDNANLFWDDTNNRFALGNTATAGTGRRAVTSGDFLILGAAAGIDVNGRTAIYYTGNGYATPAAVGSSSIGEKLVFSDLTSSSKSAIGVDGNGTLWMQSLNAASAIKYAWYGAQTGTGVGSILGVITGDASGNASFNVANNNAVATSQVAYATGDYIRIGLGGVAASATNKTTIIFNNQGAATPSAGNATSNGDKLVFLNNASSIKSAIGLESLTTGSMFFQSIGDTGAGFRWYTSSGGATLRMTLQADGSLGIGGTSFGSGTLCVFLANATAVPSTNPTGGGVLYAEAGALKWRGSSGTITTIAPA